MCGCMLFLKGNIVPTLSGGAAVVFTDVEVVKHRSPIERFVVSRVNLVDWSIFSETLFVK